jgi:hypothetical protein
LLRRLVLGGMESLNTVEPRLGPLNPTHACSQGHRLLCCSLLLPQYLPLTSRIACARTMVARSAARVQHRAIQRPVEWSRPNIATLLLPPLQATSHATQRPPWSGCFWDQFHWRIIGQRVGNIDMDRPATHAHSSYDGCVEASDRRGEPLAIASSGIS